MNGSRRLNGFARATAAAAAALVLAGCGTTPLGPAAPAPGSAGISAPPILSVASDGSFEYVAAPTATPLLARGRDGAGNGAPSRSLTSSAVIDGSVGGTVTCGRFMVTVPPGAYTGAGTITMSMDDSTLAVVDLSIAPKRLNGFAVPVGLSFNPRGLALASSVTIFWLDFKTWVDLGADPEPGTGLPTAHLQHFSKYAAGKAGW